MRKTITVPGANESESFGMTGLSAMIVSAPAYFSAETAPMLSFDRPGDQYPIENKNILQSTVGEFKNVVITGTAESAGDQITIVTVPLCLETSIQGFAGTSKALAGNTFVLTMDDTVQQLSELQLIDSEGNLPKSIYIAAGGNNVLYRWNDGSGTDPAQGNNESYVLTAEAEPVEILGIDFILNLRFLDETSGNGAKLIVTCRY